jgi:hypothetical protein
MGTMTDTALKCVVCSAEVSWADCDKGHEWCYQTECDNPLGCGDIARDCEDEGGN